MIGRTRWRFREVESTQDIAFRLAGMNAGDGTVVRADYQTAGRGRQGRSWEVPANTALMFSVLLRPTTPLHQLGVLSIRLASILCDAFERADASDISLKWPNDVLIGGRKASGILVQTRMIPDLVAVAGIGINVSTPPDALPPTATSLAAATGHDVSADDLLDDILTAIERMWTTWTPVLSGDELAAIDGLLWLRSEQVTLLDANREITGTIVGIAPTGGLRLIVDGEQQVIHAGEITRGPRPIEPARQH